MLVCVSGVEWSVNDGVFLMSFQDSLNNALVSFWMVIDCILLLLPVALFNVVLGSYILRG